MAKKSDKTSKFNPGRLIAVSLLYTGAGAIRATRGVTKAAKSVPNGFREGWREAKNELPEFKKPQASKK